MAHFIHMRMFIQKSDTGTVPGKADVMDRFEDQQENMIYEAATPKAHVFSLTPASATP
jgi:hypothetical protein